MRKGSFYTVDDYEITYDGQIINTLRLNKKTMKKENINKPYLIEQYNRFMKGVDLMDQYLCLYMNKYRSLKWYKKIIIYLIEIAISNANILYNVYEKKK